MDVYITILFIAIYGVAVSLITALTTFYWVKKNNKVITDSKYTIGDTVVYLRHVSNTPNMDVISEVIYTKNGIYYITKEGVELYDAQEYTKPYSMNKIVRKYNN